MSIICEGDTVHTIGRPDRIGTVVAVDHVLREVVVRWSFGASRESVVDLVWVKRCKNKVSEEGKSLHPLHTIAFIQQHIESTGRYPGKRCTGRTTAIALRAIAAALDKPGVPVKLRDHHDSPVAHKILGDYCYELVRKMGLKHFAFTKDDLVFGIPGAIYE